MKVPIELNFGKTQTYLNFWDSNKGKNIVCKVRGDVLLLITYDEVMDEHEKEITFSDFVMMVHDRTREQSPRT